MRPLTPIPPALLRRARLQEGLVTTSQCELHGVGSGRLVRLVRQCRWIRVTSGVYDTDPTPVPHRARPDVHDHGRRRAAWLGMLAYGAGAVAVGPTALALHGVKGLPLDIRPEVMIAGGDVRRPRDGILVRRYDGALPTVRHAGDRDIVTVLHALAQSVPALDRRHAVAVLDNAVHEGLITRAEVEVAHDLARGRRGVERTHEWWGLVDGRAESPLETFARLECIDSGVPPDELQRVFLGPSGKFLGRADLAWRIPDGRWVLLEVDGADVHSLPAALFHDRERQNRLVAEHGVLLLRATAKDLALPGKVGAEVAQVVKRHGWTLSRS